MTAMRLKRYPSPYGGIALGKMGVGRMMWSVNDLLPPGARWVEYLESTGTQWIDTGLLFNSDTDTLRVEYTNESETIHRWVFGAYSAGRKKIGISSATVSAPTFWYEDTSVSVSKSDQYFTRHVFEASSEGVSNDGSKLINFASFSTDYRLYIFALDNGGNAANFGSSKIYRHTHTRSGVKILDFAPIAIGTTGYMLDLLTGEYLQYGNKGTGSFVIGPDAPPPTI